MMDIPERDVIVIGGGPAGLTAGLYCSRMGLKTTLLEANIFGGQMINAATIENYPGFPGGISGFDLAQKMHEQASAYGLDVKSAEVTALLKNSDSFQLETSEGTIAARAVIVASGGQYVRLNVPGEDRLLGRGVSYCATCDGFLFRGKRVAVVGGGDTAISDALELVEHSQHVYVIHRRDQLRAGKVLEDRARAHPAIEFLWNTVVEEVEGDQAVAALRLSNVDTQEKSSLEVDGLFVAIGQKPSSGLLAGLVDISPTGHVMTDLNLATSVPGLFAAGDVRSSSGRQVITAAGDGALAALSVFRYLRG